MFKNIIMIIVMAVLAYITYVLYLFTRSIIWASVPVVFAIVLRRMFAGKVEPQEKKILGDKAKSTAAALLNFIVPALIIFLFLFNNPAGKRFLKKLVYYMKYKIKQQEQMYENEKTTEKLVIEITPQPSK